MCCRPFTVAPNYEFRSHHLSTTQSAERLLIWLCADAQVLQARLAQGSVGTDALNYWQERWVDPQSRWDCTVARYNRDTSGQVADTFDEIGTYLAMHSGIVVKKGRSDS